MRRLPDPELGDTLWYFQTEHVRPRREEPLSFRVERRFFLDKTLTFKGKDRAGNVVQQPVGATFDTREKAIKHQIKEFERLNRWWAYHTRLNEQRIAKLRGLLEGGAS